tara:strand:+ start:67619 stop:68008 length:390 start_codon:yes stop_codon:yes gene_type:complete
MSDKKKDLTRVPWLPKEREPEVTDATTWQDEHNAEPLFLKCDCHTEGVEVQYYREDDTDRGFYINYWKYGIDGRYSSVSLWDRLRFACKLLFRGTLHGDQVMLEPDKAEKMRDYLTEYLSYDKKIKKKT